jgi:signal transduction histidine kinase/CheY-like chemotaxis protein
MHSKRRSWPWLAVVACLLLAMLAAAASSSAGEQWPLRLDSAQLDYVAPDGSAAGPAAEVRLPDYLPAAPPGHRGRLRFSFDLQQPAELLLLVEATREHFIARVNGVQVHDSTGGDPDAPPLRSWRMSPMFALPESALRSGRNEIELELLTPAGRVLRIAPLWVGSHAAIERVALRIMLRDEIGPLAIVVVLATLAVIALVLARDSPDRQLLLLYAAGAIIYALVTLSALMPHQPLPFVHYFAWWYMLYMWSPCVLNLLALRFAGVRWPGYEKLLWTLAALALPLTYAASLMDAGLGFAGIWLLLANSLSIPLMVMLARRRWVDGNRRAGWMALFVAVGWAMALHDLIAGFVLHKIIKYYLLAPYVGLVYAFWAGWILISRYQRTASDLAVLNRELDQRINIANARLQEQLLKEQEAHHAAEQASAAKSNFLAAVSHDLRQPLHSLGMFVSALDQHVGSAEGKEMQRRVSGAFAALEGLFNELLDLSRLDAGTIEARVQPAALQPIFDRLDDLFHAEAESRGLNLRFVPTRHAVLTDPVLLERIVANLVSNALRYTPRGAVLVAARRRGGDIVVEVRDSGIGIAPEQQEKVFDDFYQVNNPARDRRRGLGLGLAIVRRLAGLLSHRIELRSQPGRGTVFGVRLPRADIEAGAAAAVAADAPQALRGKRVLVVDDEAEVREASLALLQSWGIEAIGAAAPADVDRLLAGGARIDAVIADLRLGADIDGIDVVERLRAAVGAKLPALLVSGDTGARELTRVKSSGLPLLVKPVGPARLKAALHAFWQAGAKPAQASGQPRVAGAA